MNCHYLKVLKFICCISVAYSAQDLSAINCGRKLMDCYYERTDLMDAWIDGCRKTFGCVPDMTDMARFNATDEKFEECFIECYHPMAPGGPIEPAMLESYTGDLAHWLDHDIVLSHCGIEKGCWEANAYYACAGKCSGIWSELDCI